MLQSGNTKMMSTAAIRRLSTALVCAAALAGCAGADRYETAHVYTDVHAIKVANAPVLISVPPTGPLSHRNAMRVDQIGRDFMRTGLDVITIAYPDNTNSKAVVAETARRLHKLGIPARLVRRGVYNARTYKGSGVIISFTGPRAKTEGCPEFWGDSRLNGHNMTAGRFGCATQANLAAMAADPRDLLAPAPMGLRSSERAVNVISAYTAGESTTSADTTSTTQTTE